MDKITKAIKRLSQSEKKLVQEILLSLKNHEFHRLDIKKLKGYENIFRVRKARVRIIYRLCQDNDVRILAIERRSETTYKNF